MVIYEVNLMIDKDIFAEFQLWLREHANEMLQFPGFMQASIFEQEQEEAVDQEKLIIQYQLENKAALDKYLTAFAPKMREDGIKRFGSKFSATRRFFKVLDILKQ